MSNSSKVNLVKLPLPGIAEPLSLVVLPNGDYEIEQRAIAAIAGYKSEKTVRRLLTENQGFESRTKSLITTGQPLVGQGSENAHIEKSITRPKTQPSPLTENQGFESRTKSLITTGQPLVGQGSEVADIEKSITRPEIRHIEGKDNPSNTYPLIVAVLCWQWWAERGNAQCAALLAALAAEALEVRADRIAKIERSQDERDARFAVRIGFVRGIDYLCAPGHEDNPDRWILRLPSRASSELPLEKQPGAAKVVAFLRAWRPDLKWSGAHAPRFLQHVACHYRNEIHDWDGRSPVSLDWEQVSRLHAIASN